MSDTKKFLIKKDKALEFCKDARGFKLVIGYMHYSEDLIIKVEKREVTDESLSKFKLIITNVNKNIIEEFSYDIPNCEGEYFIKNMSKKTIAKNRYYKWINDYEWCIDILENLYFAEVEIFNEEFKIPDWAIEEVTDNKLYDDYNL